MHVRTLAMRQKTCYENEQKQSGQLQSYNIEKHPFS